MTALGKSQTEPVSVENRPPRYETNKVDLRMRLLKDKTEDILKST